MNAWPRTSFPLDRAAVARAYASARATLAADPLLITNAADYGFSFDELDRRMTQIPEAPSCDALWEWLDGPDQYRWAALSVLVDAYRNRLAEPLRLTGRVSVPADGTAIVAGDVHIDGDLLVADQAMVFVLGALTVTGALVATGGDYSMVAARDIACRDGVTPGEILAVDRIVCPGTFLFWGNDYSSRARRYHGGILIDFERDNWFEQVDVRTRLADWDFDAAGRALGLPDDADITTAYAAKLLDDRSEH
jgi:hypothetical protein